jgi:hypothetical protein
MAGETWSGKLKLICNRLGNAPARRAAGRTGGRP